MEDKPKIDLQKHASSGASKWMLIKYIIYLICVAVLTWLIWNKSSSPDKGAIHPNEKEIQGVEVEVP